MSTTESIRTQLEQFRSDFAALRGQIAESVVGQQQAVETMLVALLAGGHVLLESQPGLGKTRLARTLADAVDLDYRRIQFTADLMPADITGTYVVLEAHGQRKFDFQRGPIFTQVLLADEINRAPPKTQAALLEGLEERIVTVANQDYDLPQPFFVIATQGPDEADGTFPLPETQLDRFLVKLTLDFPSLPELDAIVARSLAPPETAPAARAVGRSAAGDVAIGAAGAHGARGIATGQPAGAGHASARAGRSAPSPECRAEVRRPRREPARGSGLGPPSPGAGDPRRPDERGGGRHSRVGRCRHRASHRAQLRGLRRRHPTRRTGPPDAGRCERLRAAVGRVPPSAEPTFTTRTEIASRRARVRS